MATEEGGDTVSVSRDAIVSTPIACSVTSQTPSQNVLNTSQSNSLSLLSTTQSSAHDDTFVLDTPEASRSGEFCGGNGVFLATTRQVFGLIESVNEYSRCSTAGCNGKLKHVSTKVVGLGGDAEMAFHCTGCVRREVTYPASVVHEESQQPSLSLSLQVACICAGLSYAQYKRLGQDWA